MIATHLLRTFPKLGLLLAIVITSSVVVFFSLNSLSKLESRRKQISHLPFSQTKLRTFENNFFQSFFVPNVPTDAYVGKVLHRTNDNGTLTIKKLVMQNKLRNIF